MPVTVVVADPGVVIVATFGVIPTCDHPPVLGVTSLAVSVKLVDSLQRFWSAPALAATAGSFTVTVMVAEFEAQVGEPLATVQRKV